MRAKKETKVTVGNRVFGFIKGPLLSKEYADGARYGFEQSARVTLWELCPHCKSTYPKTTCQTPVECSQIRELAQRLRGYRDRMVEDKSGAFFCGDKKRR